jgi:hypothetical protein
MERGQNARGGFNPVLKLKRDRGRGVLEGEFWYDDKISIETG